MRLGPNFLHLIKERMVLYLVVSISARSVPGLLGQISEKYKISLFRRGGCVWAQWFGIVRKTAEGSTLCCLFQLARFQARSARKHRILQFDFSGGEIASGAQFFAFDKRAHGVSISARAVPGLLGQISEKDFTFPWGSSLGQFQLARFQAESREFYNLIFPGGRLRLGPNFLHLIKERMVLYFLVSILALSVPGLLGQISEKYKISLFRRGGCVWAQWFGLVRKTAEGSTLCCQFQLARFQARSARKPRILQFDFSGDEIASGAQFFAFDKRAYGALLFGVNFSSLGQGCSARSPILRLGSMVWHCQKDR